MSQPISRWPVPEIKDLPEDLRARILDVQAKAGFVPNVFLAFAHRLSTIEHADRVVAMDQGRIVEHGTHAQLLKAGGLYARLHAMQFRS